MAQYLWMLSLWSCLRFLASLGEKVRQRALSLVASHMWWWLLYAGFPWDSYALWRRNRELRTNRNPRLGSKELRIRLQEHLAMITMLTKSFPPALASVRWITSMLLWTIKLWKAGFFANTIFPNSCGKEISSIPLLLCAFSCHLIDFLSSSKIIVGRDYHTIFKSIGAVVWKETRLKSLKSFFVSRVN